MNARVFCRKKAWTSDDPEKLVEGEAVEAQQLFCIPGHARLMVEVEKFSNWQDYFSEDEDSEFVPGTNKAPDDVSPVEASDPDQPVKIKRITKKKEDADA